MLSTTLNRRRAGRVGSAVLAVLTAALAATACGSDAEPGTQPSGSGAPADAAFPVTVTHAFGETTIPSAPSRIVALGKNDAEAAISLGVPPVATSSGLDVYPWLQDELDKVGSTALADETGAPLEQITGLAPDLIIAMDVVDAAEYEALAAIAPTLTYQKDRFSYSWQEFTRYIAKALGRDAQADTVIADTEDKVEALVKANPDIAGKTFSLSNLSAEFPFVIYADDSPGVTFFTELGMKRSPEMDKLASGEVTVQDDYLSLEQIDLLDADVVVTSFATPEDQTFFEANRVFSGMSAAQRGAVVNLDMATIGQVLLPSALGNVAVLETVIPMLAHAAKTAA